MIRACRTELRRSAALGGGVALLVLGAVVLWSGRWGWWAGGMSLAIQQRIMLVVVWPLAAAVGAWQARRDHLARIEELLTTTPVPSWRRVLPVTLVTALAAAAAYALVAGAATIQVAGTTGYRSSSALAVTAVGVVSMAAAVCLGLGIGRALPLVVTPPAVAVVGMALLIVAQSVPDDARRFALVLSPAVLMSVRTVHVEDFLALSPVLNIAQAVWLAGLAATGVVLFAARRRARAWAALPLTLGIGAALAIAPTAGAVPGVTIDAAAQELVCTPDAPRVCVARVHRLMLPQVTPAARRALAALARLPGAPTTAAEDVTSVRTPRTASPSGTATFSLGLYGRLTPDQAAVARDIVRDGVAPSSCARPHEVADVAVDWLLGEPTRAEESDVTPVRQQARAVLDGLPPQEALRRIGAVRQAASSGCVQTLDQVLAGRTS